MGNSKPRNTDGRPLRRVLLGTQAFGLAMAEALIEIKRKIIMTVGQMKNYQICIFGILTMLYSTPVVSAECPLMGKWKSNEAKTLASMHATGKVTEQQRSLFENHYFGKLTVTITCSEMTSTYAGDSDTFAYTYVKQDGHHITIQPHDEENDKEVERELTLEQNGQCYSVPVSNLGFKEYFCKY
jgi:hypothetical protein